MQIVTVFERTTFFACLAHLEIRRKESVVDDQNNVRVLLANFSDGLDVHDFQQGVGRRLHPHHLQVEIKVLHKILHNCQFITLVLGLMAFSKRDKSVASTNPTSIPNLVAHCLK
jgi:hypothetical protein